MPKKREPRWVEVLIQTIGTKGYGWGTFTNGEGVQQPVEVPFTMPGDYVRALLLRKRGGVFASLLEEIITPSPDRINPRCKHFSSCGGCRWQHIPYTEQLKIKEDRIRSCFAKHLGAHVKIHPILPCIPEWNYRNKMEFSFSSDSQRRGYLGLILDSSRGKVFNVEECFLTNPWFCEALFGAREWWHESQLEAYYPPKDKGSLRTLTVREGMNSGDRMVVLTVSGNPDYALHKSHLETFVAFMRAAIEPIDPNKHLSIVLRIHQLIKGSPTQFYEMILFGPDHVREELQIIDSPGADPFPLRFQVSPSAFFQPNSRQAERIYSLAMQMADISPQGIVYDLYCGGGALGMCAARRAKQVVGIELSAESAFDARENAKRNQLSNMTIITGSVGPVLEQIKKDQSYPLPDIVLLDPPRSGLDPDALNHVIQLSPQKIIYISCNPDTQAKNVESFIEAGYRLQSLQPVDQFPHTIHIENIIILEK